MGLFTAVAQDPSQLYVLCYDYVVFLAYYCLSLNERCVNGLDLYDPCAYI